MNEMLERIKRNYNIDFFSYDTENKLLDNVTFILNDSKRYKICKSIFYRQGGICRILKFNMGDLYVSTTEYTDKMFYNMVETHICKFFKLIR